jgi:hypothetical protein
MRRDEGWGIVGTYPQRGHPVNVFYTYASLRTTDHPDLQVIRQALLDVGVTANRLTVMPQTVNAIGITPRETAQLAMLDPECADGANVLSMQVQ